MHDLGLKESVSFNPLLALFSPVPFSDVAAMPMLAEVEETRWCHKTTTQSRIRRCLTSSSLMSMSELVYQKLEEELHVA